MDFKWKTNDYPELAVWEGIVFLFALSFSLILILTIAVIVLLVLVIKMRKNMGNPMKMNFSIKRPRLKQPEPAQDIHFINDSTYSNPVQYRNDGDASPGFYNSNKHADSNNPLSNFSNIPPPPPLNHQGNFGNNRNNRFGPPQNYNSSDNSRFY